MAPSATAQAVAQPPKHKRTRSTDILKSIIVSRKATSNGTALNKALPPIDTRRPNSHAAPVLPFELPFELPPDHPDRAATQAYYIPSAPSSPRKSQDVSRLSPVKGLQKKTLSSVSLRSLGKNADKAKEKQTRDESPQEDMAVKIKKTKSSARLAAIFTKGDSPKKGTYVSGTDKENTTPPGTAMSPDAAHTPIWAQFSSQPIQEATTTSKVPLNDRQSIEAEIAIYTPGNYSPSKQRNFFDYGQPSLDRRPILKERPKSTVLPSTTSSSTFLGTFSRKKSDERVPLSDTKGNHDRPTEGASSRTTSARPLVRRSSSEGDKRRDAVAKQATPSPKKQNRVMAAVAAFNGKAKEAQTAAPAALPKLDPRAVDAEFEAVLESRNIPQHQRTAMRTLKLDVKADFVRTHKLDTLTMSRAASGQSSTGETTGQKSTKSTLNSDRGSHDSHPEDPEKKSFETSASAVSTKRERPKSRTFTFSKGDSPVKKPKSERPTHERKLSSKSIPKSPSVRSLISNASTRSTKATMPDDFIEYMRKTRKPQEVEVGKLHKLRQLLRNETVEWVNEFIQEGGMTELVALLHRIIEVEWREDHEDQLLHEVLRCLKGLCTTDSALKQFAEIAPTLFPALLGMLFDEEHKGPSEFTTRELLTQIIFAHLSMAPEAQKHSRATEILRYLKDPVKEKESSTVPFILQMHQPRPYQVWCKEITNVTKEVFWIFIHHLTVVPLPPPLEETHESYLKTHFPGPRAIVPAAPYVGGVEWDATNYISTHLDLINGLLASLPTREARNNLRTDMKVSGFEKLMGHLRACNPKYYGAVHDAVKVWIGAALEDGWDTKTVRMGSSDGKTPSPVKASPKKLANPPQIDLAPPKMDLGLHLGLDMQFEKEIGGPVKKDDDWF